MQNESLPGFRLSPQQERLVAIAPPANPAACSTSAFLFRSARPLQAEPLRSALASVVARHEILRTVFRKQRELKLPLQVILDEASPELTVEDLSAQPLDPAHTELLRRLNVAAQPRPASETPVLRATLFTLAGQESAVLILLPGLCADAASASVLAKQLDQALAGETPSEDILQYADVTEWQHELLAATDDAAAAAKAFWRNQAHTPLRLPLECQSATTEAAALSRVTIAHEAASSALATFARTHATAEADVLLAVWHLLLYRITGELRTVVLASSEGREYDEIRDAIGLFARSLPIAVDFEGRTSFDDLLRHVALLQKSARDQQDWFLPGSSASAAAIGFAFHNLAPEAEAPGLYAAAVRTTPDNLKLALVAQATQQGTDLAFEFDPALYTRQSIEQLASAFEVLLSAALTNPTASLAALPLVSPAARAALLSFGTGASADLSPEPIHALISAQALRTPTAEAVRSGEEVLLYSELEARSNQLAHHLRAQGVAAGSLVGLSVARTAAMMIPVLAILKTGAAYVPLAADQPNARIARQLEGLASLVIDSAMAAQMSGFEGPIILVDTANWHAEPSTPLEPSAESLAYVIYTSGSTGTPKGVGIRHRNLTNYALDIIRKLGLATEPLQFGTVSTLSADLGNTAIYPALLTGGCLHVLPYEVAADPRAMLAYQQAHPLDVLKIVPSHLEALLDGAGPGILPRRTLITGGEALKPALAERAATSGTCILVNHYGPTETTVGSLLLSIQPSDWQRGLATLPIGRPLANTQAYVLDATSALVPVGVTGELYIAGAGVSAGYLNQPAMTAERFLPNPFLPEAGPMYRTGDLVRWLPDGVLEFLGRADDQVKIRGFRVELGEIETALAAQPGVRQAVVLALTAQSPDAAAQLVAYVVLDRQEGVNATTLRDRLKSLLPDYMVPAAILELPRLPLTPNGKLDRNALPAPEAHSTRAFRAPATPTEELVAQIWATVLKVPAVSTDENFFDLGGHSLLATQVISRIRRVFELDLPLRTMFDTPTVIRIAAQVDALRLPGGASAAPVITPVSRDLPLALSFAQQRLWILDQMEPDNAVYNIPRTLRLRGPLDIAALTTSLNEIVRRHEPLRTSFILQAGEPVQHIEPTLQLNIQHIDLTTNASLQDSEARERKAREIAAIEAAKPFSLASAPLLRVVLLTLDPDDHVLLLTMHHIVSDAWSATIFMQELRAFYEGCLTGTRPDLPDLKLQYADYAAWQRQWLQGETLQQQLAFWRNQLAGAPPVLTLPADRPRPGKQTFAGALERFTLPSEVYLPLKALCRQQGTTLFMALLAGFQTLLVRLSGQEQVVVGTDSANRFSVDTERMIGFFINLLALKADLSNDPTFEEVLTQVRETTLACYAHQEMPFDKIVEELRPDRNLSHNPILQVLFVMQNAPAPTRQLGNLEVSGFGAPLTRSKFDIAVFAVEREDTVDCLWVYSTELFDPATITSMAGQYNMLLGSAVAAPSTRISALELLSEEQKRKRKDDKLERRQQSSKKLMSAGLKTVELKSVSLNAVDLAPVDFGSAKEE